MEPIPTEFRFMALPPELRCHIYSFLPELVYKHIWPVLTLSPVGVCSWPYFRLPTPLLLVNRLVYQETKDVSVQTRLQSLNEYYPPVVILGPFSGLHRPRRDFLFKFCGLLSRHNGSNSSIYDAEEIRRQITAWSNLSLRDRLGLEWEQIYERLPSDSGYSEKNLDLFITCTLTRMARNHVKEVRIRLLLRATPSSRISFWDKRMLEHLIQQRVRALENGYCDSESVITKEGVTIVQPTECCALSFDSFVTGLRQRNIGFQVEGSSTQDRRLLDRFELVHSNQKAEKPGITCHANFDISVW